MSSAQSALMAFENELQSNKRLNPLSQLFNNNSTLGNDLQNLQTALQSNDSTKVQNAFKTLIQDMQGAMQTHGAHHRHHHHRVDNDGDSDDQGFGSAPISSGSDTDSDSAASSATVGSTLNVQA